MVRYLNIKKVQQINIINVKYYFKKMKLVCKAILIRFVARINKWP